MLDDTRGQKYFWAFLKDLPILCKEKSWGYEEKGILKFENIYEIDTGLSAVTLWVKYYDYIFYEHPFLTSSLPLFKGERFEEMCEVNSFDSKVILGQFGKKRLNSKTFKPCLMLVPLDNYEPYYNQIYRLLENKWAESSPHNQLQLPESQRRGIDEMNVDKEEEFIESTIHFNKYIKQHFYYDEVLESLEDYSDE